jgi:LPXTG-motif cell wall-anchored protein
VKVRTAIGTLTLVFALVTAMAAPALAASVSMVDFDFQPSTVTISVGQSVTWSNNASDPHTSTSDSGAWDSGTVNAGGSFTHTFNSVGTFAYHCTFHVALGMVGTVVVQAAGTGTGEPLPNTGASSSTVPFVVIGLLLLVTGAGALFVLRRRHA